MVKTSRTVANSAIHARAIKLFLSGTPFPFDHPQPILPAPAGPGIQEGKTKHATGAIRVVHQEGSHVVLETDIPSHQRIAVLPTANIRIGTLNAILRSVAQHKGVDREELLRSLR